MDYILCLQFKNLIVYNYLRFCFFVCWCFVFQQVYSLNTMYFHFRDANRLIWYNFSLKKSQALKLASCLENSI